jgi:hypothetical protein
VLDEGRDGRRRSDGENACGELFGGGGLTQAVPNDFGPAAFEFAQAGASIFEEGFQEGAGVSRRCGGRLPLGLAASRRESGFSLRLAEGGVGFGVSLAEAGEQSHHPGIESLSHG